MTLIEDIAKNNIFLVVTSKDKYGGLIASILPDVEKSSGKLCYITINKPYNTLIKNISDLSLNKDKFFFIDAITSTVQTPPIVNNCIFVTSPTALTDLGLAFSSALTEKNCDMAFFDTLSTLSVYQDSSSVIKFAHNIITKARVMNKKIIFVALKEDSETLIKDLNMFVDKIIEM
jgi:hypothetical protein